MSNEELISSAGDNNLGRSGARKSWVKILLTVSLALNLLFVGGIIGAGWMRHKHGAGGHGGPPDFMVKRLLGHLPQDKQQLISAQISGHQREMGELFEAVKANRQALKTALRAEPFDADLVQTLAQNMQHPRRVMIDKKISFMVQVLKQLTPEERQKILKHRFMRMLFSRHRSMGRHRSN